MPVYMIRQGERGPVKIGVAKDVTKRLENMQTGNHERLVLLRSFEGGAAEKRQLHRQFADHRLSGEWFSFTKGMLGDVGLVKVGTTPDDVTKALRKLVISSRAAAARRPPSPQPTEAEKALLTAKFRELVSISKEARHRTTHA